MWYLCVQYPVCKKTLCFCFIQHSGNLCLCVVLEGCSVVVLTLWLWCSFVSVCWHTYLRLMGLSHKNVTNNKLKYKLHVRRQIKMMTMNWYFEICSLFSWWSDVLKYKKNILLTGQWEKTWTCLEWFGGRWIRIWLISLMTSN